MKDFDTFWTCRNCNEEVEEQFEVCWNCQADRAGVMPTDSSSLSQPDQDERSFLSEKWRDKHCVQCATRLMYVGKKQFHEGIKWGVLGDFGELFVGHLELQMYFCPACHRVEFFV